MNPTDPIDAGAISTRLEAELSKLQVGVAVLLDDGARVLRASSPAVPAFTTRTPIAAGCLAKPMVATLIALAAQAQRLQLRDCVASWMEGTARGAFPEAIRIHHLLTHTHGLDDSCLLTPPRDGGGRIDGRRFFESVAALARIAPPGTVFTCGHVGPWIAAALLETVHDMPYARSEFMYVETMLRARR
jgi:CubicO group peptidase (beta-lactamase class C family)